MMLSGPKHGYQLKHEAGLIFGRQALHNNVIYPMLRQFLEEEWVGKKEVPGERGQTRQQYTLTPQGRAVLLQGLAQFTEADAASDDAFRFRVALFKLLAPKVRKRILDLRESYLQALDGRMAALEGNMHSGSYANEVVHQLRQHIELETKWIARLRVLKQKGKGRRI
jgi:DNA-binding PadR family transcriptional regulator